MQRLQNADFILTSMKILEDFVVKISFSSRRPCPRCGVMCSADIDFCINCLDLQVIYSEASINDLLRATTCYKIKRPRAQVRIETTMISVTSQERPPLDSVQQTAF